MINEHDMTKSMIDTMRAIRMNENQVEAVTPATEVPQQQTTDNSQTQEIKEISFLDDSGNLKNDIPANMRVYWDGTESEKEKFMSGVSPNVSFTNFTITPKTPGNEGDVKISGVLNDFNIGFTMNKKQDLGLRISTSPTTTSQPGVTGEALSTNDVKVTPELISLLNKLNGYYENWYKEWATKLNTENFGNA